MTDTKERPKAKKPWNEPPYTIIKVEEKTKTKKRRHDTGVNSHVPAELDKLLEVTVDPNAKLENEETDQDRVENALSGIPWDEYRLTHRQRAFIEYYCADPTNATRAALNAGYAPTVAAKEACLMLKRPKISAIIATVMNLRIERTALTKDKVLHELEVLLTTTIDDFEIGPNGRVTVKEGRPVYLIKAIKNIEFSVENIIRPDGTQVQNQSTKIWLYNKEAILRMAGQYHKMYTDNTDIRTPDGIEHRHKWDVGGKEITF
jgi:phage terminase small subunit